MIGLSLSDERLTNAGGGMISWGGEGGGGGGVVWVSSWLTSDLLIPSGGSDSSVSGCLAKPQGEISSDSATKETDGSGPQLFHRFRFHIRPTASVTTN